MIGRARIGGSKGSAKYRTGMKQPPTASATLSLRIWIPGFYEVQLVQTPAVRGAADITRRASCATVDLSIRR